MQLTNMERGSLYWARDIIKKEIAEDEAFCDKYEYKDQSFKKIDEIALKKKKEYLLTLENLLKRFIK